MRPRWRYLRKQLGDGFKGRVASGVMGGQDEREPKPAGERSEFEIRARHYIFGFETTAILYDTSMLFQL